METKRVQTKQSETRENGMTKVIVWMKQSFESKWSIGTSTEIWLQLSKVELETEISGNGATNFGQTRLAGQRGPPLEAVNFHSDQSIPFISQPKLLKILAQYSKHP